MAGLTDARFNGVSTGSCIGHISPEALAGGAIGEVQEGDRIEVVIDRQHLEGSLHLVGDAHEWFGAEDKIISLLEKASKTLPCDLRSILTR
jgi:dihydroxyacid dehydratase/phosphogluconate dehydratase